MALKKLTKSDIRVNVKATYDSPGIENHQYTYLSGCGIWYGCKVQITVSWKYIETSIILEHCDYDRLSAFRASSVYELTVNECLSNLNNRLLRLYNDLQELVQ